MKQAQTLKGFRDFLPQEAAKRRWLKDVMRQVFEKWGYEPLETPTLEPLDLFVGKIGEDEKLFYKFEDSGGRKVALRYDQTVPTCRVIGQYSSKLIFPFRRYQIQPVFRAEKPQKGRYREFIQSDIDIFGEASPIADAEAIAVSLDLYRTLGFKEVIAIINNRDLMQGIPYTAIVAIDKLKKIGEEGVIQDMANKGIEEKEGKQYLERAKSIKPDETIRIIFDYLKKSGFSESWYKFEPTLARSFSYSQGPIWEIIIPEYSAGSVGGGERYDGLMEKITGKKIPATGIAFGFDRTLEVVEELALIPNFSTVAQILITIFSSDLKEKSIEISSRLRANNINTELYLDENAKLGKQLQYADRKKIPYVIIIGPDEVAKNVIKLRNMTTREEQEMTIEEAIKKLCT